MFSREEFEAIVAEEFTRVPERFQKELRNVAFLVEDEPSAEVRAAHSLKASETLLGHYQGIPLTQRGDGYGVGATLPDMITIYQLPTEKEAAGDRNLVRTIVRETIFHEIAHYLGMGEGEVEEWERRQVR